MIFPCITVIGRAAITVAILKIGKIPYELETVPGGPEFAAIQGDTSRFPLQQVPVLTLPDGQIVTQSGAIARYAAKLAGLYPEDPLLAIKVDEIIEAANDLGSSVPQNADNELKKQLREAWTAGKLQKFLAFFATKSMSGSYLVGGKLSLADLYLYQSLKSLRNGQYDYVPSDVDAAYPALGVFFDFLKADPDFSPFA